MIPEDRPGSLSGEAALRRRHAATAMTSPIDPLQLLLRATK
jgi:hypothetical protein